ncbi:LysE family transporter [Paenibacillus sp. GP183]|jgi:L-lysine exporter family protein LysE/ArgO|uniref:LysE/ArgO family amino acid transporter n=1 Tax=Paenibacillus sp. GP183 TaxID=1882751 RepID=UPI00089D01AD|nr:LysE family transporter [Paenibacillus sp. GP183]SEB54303.1 L-lysine exporter family protein LysE/ArgO [Paenibacillus sp. GP183]
MAVAYLHGLILAIGLILPLGVQNFYIFTQGAVNQRFVQVLPIVITACLCDSLLILLAVLGVSLVVMKFVWMKTLLIIGGFVFLVYMGIITWRSKVNAGSSNAAAAETISIRRIVGYTLMISLLNPHAILDTIGVLGTSSLSYQGVYKIAFTAACLTVSWCWFFSLALAGRLVGLKDKSGSFIRYLNKISAVVMWTAAVYLIYVF